MNVNGGLMNKWWMAVCVLLLASSPLYAQIKVEKSAGVDTAGAQTKLILQTPEATTPVYLVTGESSMSASGSGVYGNTVGISGSGVSTTLICDAPAELTLDGGIYQFQLTKRPMFNGIFKVNATGGTQVWEVKQGWGRAATPFIMGGLGNLAIGLTLMILGALLSLAEVLLRWLRFQPISVSQINREQSCLRLDSFHYDLLPAYYVLLAVSRYLHYPFIQQLQ